MWYRKSRPALPDGGVSSGTCDVLFSHLSEPCPLLGIMVFRALFTLSSGIIDM